MLPCAVNNIYQQIPHALPEELFEVLINTPNFKLERIVSQGHASPKDFWYDQDDNEWVILLQGQAQLVFVGQDPVLLNAGDYIHIAAHVKHRVAWTAPDTQTIWLALHY